MEVKSGAEPCRKALVKARAAAYGLWKAQRKQSGESRFWGRKQQAAELCRSDPLATGDLRAGSANQLNNGGGAQAPALRSWKAAPPIFRRLRAEGIAHKCWTSRLLLRAGLKSGSQASRKATSAESARLAGRKLESCVSGSCRARITSGPWACG